MPRTMSEAALAALNAETTDEVFLVLAVIDHADLSEPLRFVSGADAEVTSGGATYTPAPFSVSFPADGTDRLPRVTLTVPAVDDMVMETLGSVVDPPSCSLSMALASDPDTVEFGPFDMLIQEARDEITRTLIVLGYEDILNRPLIDYVYSPTIAPGLHR